MSLTLTIVSHQSASPGIEGTKVFGHGGGDIGRSADNAWELPDPERFISSQHARISWEDGRYLITDISLNGTSVNGEPIGTNNTQTLANSDRIGIGDYQISVAIEAEEGPSLEVPTEPAPAYGSPKTLGAGPVLPEEITPLGPPAGLEAAGPEPGFDPFAPGEKELEETREMVAPMRDDLAPVHEPFQAPQAAPETPEIPENWWDETGRHAAPEPEVEVKPTPAGPGPLSVEVAPMLDEATPSEEPPPQVREKVAVPAPPVEQVPGPEAKPAPGVVSNISEATTGAALAAFLRGAGLTEAGLRRVDEAALMELVGEVFRELVQGIMEVLMARASIKSEARVPVTTVQPLENNPLKFSFTVEEALEKLLEPESKTAYLEPKRAIREALEDIKAHQVATLAGLEAALKELFRRFDPERMEEQLLEHSMVDNLMPSHRKARCWDAFTAHFRRMAEEAEGDFQRLFGREFARAYEEQARRLKSE